MKVLQKKEFDGQWCRAWKWCEIEQWANEEISEVGQNGKIEETPAISNSEHTEVLEYI